MILESATISAIVIALVEVIKRTGTIDTTKYAPALSLILGVGLSLLNGITQDNFVIGMIAGLVASGAYDNLKSGGKITGIIK